MTTDTLELPELPERFAVMPKLILPEVHGMGGNTTVLKQIDAYTAAQMRAYALQYGELVRERCARIAECEVLRGTFTQEEREYWGELIASAIRNKE